MVRVESEAIADIDYDAASCTLFVRFIDGDRYAYFGVPAHIRSDFLAAPSHGRYFHDRIRDRYPFKRGR